MIIFLMNCTRVVCKFILAYNIILFFLKIFLRIKKQTTYASLKSFTSDSVTEVKGIKQTTVIDHTYCIYEYSIDDKNCTYREKNGNTAEREMEIVYFKSNPRISFSASTGEQIGSIILSILALLVVQKSVIGLLFGIK